MSVVRHFPVNTSGRDFLLGDLHGCMSEFNALLEAVKFDRAVDRVFAVGDLVDRGPDSMGALRLLREPWFFTVLGNHEAMMLNAMTLGDPYEMELWIANGGAWHGDHLGDELDSLLVDVDSLPLAIVVGDGAHRFNVVHAEFFGSDAELSAGDFDGGTVQRLLWGRALASGRAPADLTQPESVTYVGHSIVETIGRVGSHRFIDTGAFLPHTRGEPGFLTMIEHATGKILQATTEAIPA